MFEEFYGFKATPFSRTIPPENLYPSTGHEDTQNRLFYAAGRQLFAVLTGSSGAGKTTALRGFCESLKNTEYRVLYISDSKLTPRHFYKGLLEQLGCEAKFYRGDAKRQLHKEIEVMKAIHHIKPVVLVDEAHLLDKEMLEEVRFLLNFKMDSESPMALILAGQTELWDRLKLQAYAAIRQRIDIMCFLPPLDLSQTYEYMKAHLSYAGANGELFTDAAIDEIFSYSSGIPRLINKVCTGTLIYAAQNRKMLIDDRMIRLVIEGELS